MIISMHLNNFPSVSRNFDCKKLMFFGKIIHNETKELLFRNKESLRFRGALLARSVNKN